MKTTGYVALLSLFFVPFTTISAPNTPPITHQSVEHSKKINLNTATADQLTHAFRGIGQKRAAAIVDYRKTHGQFQSIDELAKVKGIGKFFVHQHLDGLQNVFALE